MQVFLCPKIYLLDSLACRLLVFLTKEETYQNQDSKYCISGKKEVLKNAEL
jgi:hypothetical protein